MTKKVGSYMWKLCESCTVRNCKRQPVPTSVGFTCTKRRSFAPGFSLLELAMKNFNSMINTVELCYEHGFRIKETNDGSFRLQRRPLKEGEHG